MYAIISNAREVGLTEHPTYIALQDNGYYRLASPEEAQAVNFEGKVYRLADREVPEDMQELPAAWLVEADAGLRITNTEQANSIVFVTMAQSGAIDDVTAGEHADFFPEWNPNNVSYTAGQIVRHKGKLYKCVTQHNSQESWAPDIPSALWTQIADPSEEWPAWSQPVGAHDAYMKGDKVTYQGKHYQSLIDNNVWTPDAYPQGWEEVSEN